MTPAGRARLRVRAPLMLVSGAAWILLVAEPCGAVRHAHHAATMLGASPSPSALDLLLAPNSPASHAAGWALMVAAMMLPLLTRPVQHVRDRSFARRRARATALFLAGYAVMWMATGALLLALVVTIRLAAPGSSAVALAVMTLVALVWQCSPLKQRCLNRGHAHPELPAFGGAADLGAFRFGLTHGIWCVGSCWALMLLPLLVPGAHHLAMAVVALWLLGERIHEPGPPRWCVRAPAQAARIAVAQARTWLSRIPGPLQSAS